MNNRITSTPASLWFQTPSPGHIVPPSVEPVIRRRRVRYQSLDGESPLFPLFSEENSPVPPHQRRTLFQTPTPEHVRERGGTAVSAGSINLEELNRVLDESVENTDSDAEVCSVCLDDLEACQSVRPLLCLHMFHVNCLERWFRRVRNCPTCRFQMQEDFKDP